MYICKYFCPKSTSKASEDCRRFLLHGGDRRYVQDDVQSLCFNNNNSCHRTEHG